MTGLKKKMINLACAALCAALMSSCAAGTGGETGDKTASPETAPAEATPVSDTADVNDIIANLYPTPGKVTLNDGIAAGFVKSDESSDYSDEISNMGLSAADGIPLEIETDETLGGEAYVLAVSETEVKIKAGGDSGVYYALKTLKQLQFEDKDGTHFPCVAIEDSPSVQFRGVIEGFYGTAWSSEFRLELMKFMGDVKMNTYIYAPKDDAKLRASWRSLYTEKELAVLTELVNAAKASRVNFVYAISPGNDINLSGKYDSEFEKLCEKCQQMYDIGVRNFSILLDDIPTLDASGHAKLLNDFNEKFLKTHEGCGEMIAITTEFTDSMLTSYTDTLAPLIDSDIQLMWTGNGVVPSSITCASLKKITEKYGRKVLIWWNYPTNDTQTDHLYADACRSLASDLADSITGLVSNPMNQSYASIIPMFTTADYLWNMTAYDADRSLERAAEYFDPEYAEILETFVSTVGASPMNNWTSNSALKALLDKFDESSYDDILINQLIAESQKIADIGKLSLMSNSEFVTECSDWIAKAEAYGNMAVSYFSMEKAYHEGKIDDVVDLSYDYAMWRNIAAEYSCVVSQNTLTSFLTDITQRINILCGVTEETTGVEVTAMADKKYLNHNRLSPKLPYSAPICTDVPHEFSNVKVRILSQKRRCRAKRSKLEQSKVVKQ